MKIVLLFLTALLSISWANLSFANIKMPKKENQQPTSQPDQNQKPKLFNPANK